MPSLVLLSHLSDLPFVNFLELDQNLQTCSQKIAPCFLTSKKSAIKNETRAVKKIFCEFGVSDENRIRPDDDNILRQSLAQEHPLPSEIRGRPLIRPSVLLNGIKKPHQKTTPYLSETSVSCSIEITKFEEKEVPSNEIEHFYQNLSQKMTNYGSKVRNATAKTIKAEHQPWLFKEEVRVNPVKRGAPQPIVINTKNGLLKTLSIKRDTKLDSSRGASQNHKNLLKKFIDELATHVKVHQQGYDDKTRDQMNLEIALTKVGKNN